MLDTIEYVSGIKNSILNDVRDVALFQSRRDKRKSAGYFSTPREVFCYVDSLGYLAFGGESTKRSIKFIKTYFPSKYSSVAELIHSMWRHGTIHKYHAKIDGLLVKIAWFANNSTQKRFRKGHLMIFTMKDKQADLRIVVNTCQLVDDLLYAVDEYLNCLKKNLVLRRGSSQRAQAARNFKDCSTFNKIGKEVYNQIVHCLNNTNGAIDNYGQTY